MRPSMRATHRSGTATSTPTKVTTRRGRGFRLLIRNTEAAGGETLNVSFDSGNTYYPIPPQEELKEDIAFHFFYVTGTGLGAGYKAIILEG